MIRLHYYSNLQIEEMSNELNRRYDERRLITPKTVDVYDLVDMLGARIAFEYLSTDRTCLGMTIFAPVQLCVWSKKPNVNEMRPTLKSFYGGTIVIERNLNEGNKEQDRLSENFTVMHECFHFDKHQEEFRYFNNSYSFSSYRKEQEKPKGQLRYIEHQANYAAATFLMPRIATINAAKEMLGYRDDSRPIPPHSDEVRKTIKEMGRRFGVNFKPMLYRLQEIGIVESDSKHT